MKSGEGKREIALPIDFYIITGIITGLLVLILLKLK
jgi:hypothetical protein